MKVVALVILAIILPFGTFPMMLDGSYTDPDAYNQATQLGRAVGAHGTGDGAYLQFIEVGDRVTVLYDDIGAVEYVVTRRQVLTNKEYHVKLRQAYGEWDDEVYVATCVYGGTMFATLRPVN